MILANRKRKPATAPTLGQRFALCVYASVLPVLAIGLAGPASSQTVDCAYPLGPVAQTICNDPELTELDLDIGDAFRELIRATPRAERPVELRSQRDWLIQRNTCLGEVDVRGCLRAEIEFRLTDLSQGLASSINADEPFGRALPATEPAAEPQGPRETIDSVELDPPPGSPPEAGDPSGTNTGPLPPRVGGTTPPASPPGEDRTSPDIASGDTEPGQPGVAQPPVIDDDPEPPKALEPAPAPLNDADAQEIAKFLSSRVWRAEIASGIRPGTIYMFHANGLLLTADCVEAYRIGSWQMEGAGLKLKDGAGRNLTAEIIDRGNSYVRLKLTENRSNKVLDLVFRPARSPFACTASR